MDWIEHAGYLAALLMFVTFYMKKMIPLRAVGICSNIAFIVLAAFSGVYTVLILHICILPLNIYRMLEMMKLIKKAKKANTGDLLSMDFLSPYMKEERFKKGVIVFKKGDLADKMYCLRKGTARLVEFDINLPAGEVIGEMGIFSPDKVRTGTVQCDTDAEFLYILDSDVLQLYYQNPDFGLQLMQLIISRFSADMDLKDNDEVQDIALVHNQ